MQIDQEQKQEKHMHMHTHKRTLNEIVCIQNTLIMRYHLDIFFLVFDNGLLNNHNEKAVNFHIVTFIVGHANVTIFLH